MARTFQMDAASLGQVEQKLTHYGPAAVETVNQTLAQEAPSLIEQEIFGLLPSSRRSWKKKKTSARSASQQQLFRADAGNLFVTVRTKTAYNYLYFPDDGSNTKHHFGNQQFMIRGAEAAAGAVAQRIVTKLTEQFES